MAMASNSTYHYPLRNPFDDPPNDDPGTTPTASEFSLYPMQSVISSGKTQENHIRTPSPTPSEARELKTGAINWKGMLNWRFWLRREWLWYYVAVVIIVVVTALVTIYHKQIVHWLTPATKWIHDLPFGWLVPIAIMFVISFPPLFGHEIVAILCGLVWGLWVGFAIVAAGTFLGEVGNFYAFKACCRSRGEKMERTNLSYACLAKVVRDGGFKIALIARLSAIPGHFTTAIFSTCGMNIFVFSLAAVLSLPKQFITVYLGVILEQSGTGTTDKKSRIISDVVLAITILITALAMWYILHEMNKVKPEIIYQRRRARIKKMMAQDVASIDSDTIPLTTTDMPYQHWDKRGAPTNASEVELFAPVPERAMDYSQGYQMIHGTRQPRNEEEVEWDASSVSAYAGIEEMQVEESVSRNPIGNVPSAMSSTSTVYAPVPQRQPEFLKPGNLARLQTHPTSGASDAVQTPTQGAYVVSLDTHSHTDGERTAVPTTFVEPHTNEGQPSTTHETRQSEDVTNLPYRSVLERSSTSPSPDSSPPPRYRS